MSQDSQITHLTADGVSPEQAAQAFFDMWKSAPDEYFKPGECRHCGKSLGSSLQDMVIPLGAFGYLPNVCCSDCSEAGKARIEAESALARNAQFSSVVPAEFISWDQGRGNNAALSRAMAKFNPATRRGMILHGTSGTCKTRIMWELVKELIAAPSAPSWLFLDSYDCATVGFPPESARVDFLFLDDLGNEPTSTKFETALLRLLRKRNEWHKPTLVSTQLTGEAFVKRFFVGTAGAAIFRRFSERSDKIPMHEVTKETQNQKAA